MDRQRGLAATIALGFLTAGLLGVAAPVSGGHTEQSPYCVVWSDGSVLVPLPYPVGEPHETTQCVAWIDPPDKLDGFSYREDSDDSVNANLTIGQVKVTLPNGGFTTIRSAGDGSPCQPWDTAPGFSCTVETSTTIYKTGKDHDVCVAQTGLYLNTGGPDDGADHYTGHGVPWVATDRDC